MIPVPANPRLEAIFNPQIPPITQSPSTISRGQTPSVNTLLASPLADRLAGVIVQQQEQALEAKVVDAVRQALHFLANRRRLVDPKQAASIERMAAQLLQYFPSIPQPSPAAVERMATGIPQMAIGPLSQTPPGPVATGMPLI